MSDHARSTPAAGDEEPSTSDQAWLGHLVSQSRVSKPCLAWLKMCRTLEKKIPEKAFKHAEMMPYVPGAVVGRDKRRAVVRRLTVQHAVCLLMKLLGRAELVTVEEAFKMLGQKKGQTVFAWAKEKALKQEAALFGPGKGPSAPVYLSTAGKASALDWWENKFKEELEAERVWKDGDGATRGDTQTKKRKAQAPLEEWELDFAAIQARRKSGMQRKVKPVIVALIDEQLASIEPELKLDLLRDVQATCEKEFDPILTLRSDDDQLRALLVPIVDGVIHRVYESPSNLS